MNLNTEYCMMNEGKYTHAKLVKEQLAGRDILFKSFDVYGMYIYEKASSVLIGTDDTIRVRFSDGTDAYIELNEDFTFKLIEGNESVTEEKVKENTNELGKHYNRIGYDTLDELEKLFCEPYSDYTIMFGFALGNYLKYRNRLFEKGDESKAKEDNAKKIYYERLIDYCVQKNPELKAWFNEVHIDRGI